MQVKAHCLREISKPVTVPPGVLGYRDFVAEPDWKRNLISTTSVLFHPQRRRIVCGLTAFDTDLMYEFDPDARTWHSLDYPSVSHKFEIKIHRSLCLGKDGSVYGATAGLHREDQRQEAPGGRIFRYDYQAQRYDMLGTPVPPDYIQTITLDEDRGLIYGVSYPVFRFFVFDFRARATRFEQYVGCLPHIMAIDDNGCIWSTWSNRTHYLFKYDPDANRMHFFHHGLPNAKEGVNLMFPGMGPIDTMLNGGDGYVYIGMTTGLLVRIVPGTGEVEYLGKPTPEMRIVAMAVGPDGRLYGTSGHLGKVYLFAYDRRKRTFDVFGQLRDSETGTSLFIAHDMCFTDDGRIFVGETDTMDRAGYLWECWDI